MVDGLRVADNGIDWLKQIVRSHTTKQPEATNPEEPKQRRWGVMRVFRDLAPMLECYLPPDHKIYATKTDPADSCDEHIIEGPDMPPHRPGSRIEKVDILLYVDDSGIHYGYWSHMQARRWPIAFSSALIGD